jgi:uncharacterized cupin superfamily protein
MSFLHQLKAASEPAWEPVPADRVISGAPQIRLWVHYDNPAEKLSAGEWEASPGKWRIAYTEWEYVRVISGRGVLTGEGGSSLTIGPGDTFVLEPGFVGSWEVLETMRKQWVVRE